MGVFDCAAQRGAVRRAARRQSTKSPPCVFDCAAQHGAMRRAARRESTTRPKNNPTSGWLADTYSWLGGIYGWLAGTYD